MDGLDLALTVFGRHGEAQLVAGRGTAIPADLRQQLLALTTPGENEIRRMGAAHVALGRHIGQEILSFLESVGLPPRQVCAIGCHGQTIRHYPDDDLPFTLQIGDPNVIAEITGIDTIADFRARDLAAGGQGAPLVPAFHHFLLHEPDVDKGLVNIGGMANLTLLRADGGIFGFDTGPGNILSDYWCQEKYGMPMDAGGLLADFGECNPQLLEAFLDDEFFRRSPPKSTGREHFNGAWLEDKISLALTPKPEDVLATLAHLVALSVAEGMALADFHPAGIWVCGGGRLNQTLMRELRRACPAPVRPVEDLGIDGDFLEAMAFAWLARAHLAGHAGNVPEVTGSAGYRILGGLFPGHNTGWDARNGG